MQYLLTTFLYLILALPLFSQKNKIIKSYKNAKLKSITYYEGKLTSKYVKYFENGKIQEVINYSNGSEFGWHIYYDSSGRKTKADYLIGFDAIPYEKIHDTIPGLMTVDVISSIHYEYYSSGNVKSHGYIIHAQKVGQWVYYKNDRTIDRIEYFDCLKYDKK
jgi:antitoxin component YwqK of YwqJK toxin-antitoxin module